MTDERRTVLVTGGAGFIGSHAARAFLDRGYAVTVLDSLVSGARENVPAGATFVQGDIRDEDALARACRGAYGVVHLAALVSVPESVQHPEETLDVNVRGTSLVFEAALRAGCKRVVYASSAAVYGDEPSLPKREDSPLRPQSPYAESKVENERLAERLAARGLSSLGLRFFNVYGPGQRADHAYASVIPQFVARAKRGEALSVSGDGAQTRDFVHVRDVADALVRALESSTTGVCNIASGTETSVAALAALIQERYPVAVEHGPARAGDILHSVADIEHAKELLAWTPRTAFSDGLAELLA